VTFAEKSRNPLFYAAAPCFKEKSVTKKEKRKDRNEQKQKGRKKENPKS